MKNKKSLYFKISITILQKFEEPKKFTYKRIFDMHYWKTGSQNELIVSVKRTDNNMINACTLKNWNFEKPCKVNKILSTSNILHINSVTITENRAASSTRYHIPQARAQVVLMSTYNVFLWYLSLFVPILSCVPK